MRTRVMGDQDPTDSAPAMSREMKKRSWGDSEGDEEAMEEA